MDTQTFINFAMVLLFVLIGGVFAATEIALVSLRDSQLTQLERRGAHGVRARMSPGIPTGSWPRFR